MAYWLYCTSCQQWSKSTTPLSDDKTCSFCNKKFANSNTQPEELIIPDAERVPAEAETAEMAEELGETETTETSAIPEEEISVSDETQEEPDASVIETVPEADTPDTSDETAMTEVVEIAEVTETPPTSELPKPKPALTKKSVSDKKGRSKK